MASTDFYQQLPGFRDFAGITDDGNFRAAPRDWKVIITDVKDSTGAIEAGRYKDVNTIGAASIVAAHNALGRLEFPYVFGGDGAALLIPPEYEAQTAEQLLALQQLARGQFGLELRAGLVGVDELLAEGAAVDVAKFVLVEGRSVAIFRGGGLSLAETKVKASEEAYALKDEGSGTCDLHRLSCRWRPIPPQRGRALSLLVAARGDDPVSSYAQVLDALAGILDGRLDQANPIHLPQMSYHSVAECYRHEKRMHASAWSFAFLRRLTEIVCAVLVFRFGVHPLVFSPRRYATSMAAHSDYRKFDDMLRMILDCSPEQIARIRACLEELHRGGRIYYGLHESDHALMTCFVDGLTDGEHVHFVDGGDGGYALAAKGLKAQVGEGAG